MTSTRSTIVLCLVAAIAVAAAAWMEQARPASATGRRPEVRRLFPAGALPVDRVHAIRIARPDEPDLVFERSADDRWQQTEPFAYPMDAYSVRQLAVTAAALEAVDEIDLGAEDDARTPAAVGLDPPRAGVVLEWRGGSVALALGTMGFAGRAYLRREGESVIRVVNQDLHDRVLYMDAREWRDRRIFHDVGVGSDRVEIASASGHVVLERDDRQWHMRAPVRNRLDEVAGDELLTALSRSQSGGFILDEPDDLSRFGLASPAASVVVTTSRVVQRPGGTAREPEVQRLLIGSRMGAGAQDRFALVEGRPVVIRVTEEVLRALFRPARDLVDATASGSAAADVKSLRIGGPGGELRLERDLERWITPGADGRELPYEQVERFLETLTARRAIAIELREYPRELEVATITMFGYTARPLDTVRIAREPDRDGRPGRWILENGDDVLRFFPPDLELPLTLEEFGG